jgi:hypothetical protein
LGERIADELPGLELWAMTRADAVRPELFGGLVRAGFRNVFVGVESGADAVLRRFRKGTRASMNDRAITTLKDLGVTPQLGFIMLEPKMSWTDLGENLAFLRRAGCFTRHNLTNRLNVYHGAPMYEAGVVRGDIRPSDEVTERFLYEFEDPLVGRFSEVSAALQRHGFVAKMDVWEAVNASKELRIDLARERDPACRDWPDVADLVAATEALERQEADAWLTLLEELHGALAASADGPLPARVDAVLEPVRAAAARLVQRVAHLRAAHGVVGPPALEPA